MRPCTVAPRHSQALWGTPRRVKEERVRTLSFFACLCAAAACLHCARPKSPPSVSDTPEAIATDYWELLLAESPLWATQLGDRRFDSALPDISYDGRGALHQRKQELLTRMEGINAGFLEPTALITARFLATMMTHDHARDVCQKELWDIDPLGGYATAVLGLGTYQPLDSPEAGVAYVTRLNRVGLLFDQHKGNLISGLQQNYVAAKVVVDRAVHQLQQVLAQPDAQWPLFEPLARAKNLPPAQLIDLRADIADAIHTTVRPTLAAYHKFLRDDYAPQARNMVGVSTNAGGTECYAALVAEYTGAQQDPQQLHDAGRLEVERLRAAMQEIAEAEGHRSVAAYAAALRRDPAQYLGSREAVLAHNRALVDRALRVLPSAFDSLPAGPMEVRAIEPFREQDAPAGFYEPAPADGSQPAVYYINAYRPQTRPLFNMAALAFHEAVPGHHLQIAKAAEQAALPPIRRYAGQTAFVEGWGLYAELLADDLHLYETPAERFGMLNFQAWRAARWVVDTGLHALNWTRAEAVRYMQENLLLPDSEIANEVDRYIVWPGQALAYWAGRTQVLQLRAEAQHKQGAKFDLRAFHKVVLSEGAVPLNVLRERVEQWLAAGATQSTAAH